VLVSGGTLSDRAAAVAAVDTAQAALLAARARYEQARSGTDSTRNLNAQQAVLDAQAQVNAAQQQSAACAGSNSFFGSGCVTAQQELAAAQSRLILAQANQLRTAEVVSPARVSVLYSEIQAAANTLETAQARLIQLDHPSPDAVQTAQSAVETAQASFDTALARQNQLRNPTAASVATATTAVETAENDMRSARVRLDLLLAGGTPQDQAAADAAIDEARGLLAQAQAKREGLAVPSAADVAAARAAVDTATANLASAEQKLASVAGTRTAADLQAALSAVEQAQNTLYTTRLPYRDEEIRQQREKVANARATLALKSQPYVPQDVAAARATVEQARGAYELAREQETEALVYAPIDGVVSAKLLDVGGLASPTTPIVSIVGNQVETWVNVEEADLRLVRLGSTAALTTPSYPGETFNAQVTVISPSGDARSRTFQTKLVPDNRDSRLRDGMFARVAIRGEERPDAVRIPVNAIVRKAGRNYAFVLVDGKAQRRELQLGIVDGNFREVTEGLAPGEALIVSGQTNLNDGDRVVLAQGNRT
jgi:RND family efflux transporter MFP subunit